MIFVDIEGRSAQFRKLFYNSSNISSYAPTRICVFGILASILGYKHDSYHNYFTEAKISICILSSPLYKQSVMLDYREPKFPQSGNIMTPTIGEYIKSRSGKVKYRIYYCGDLERNIIDGLTSFNGYHVYLGVTECLASITDFGECNERKKLELDDFIDFHSIIPLELIEEIDINRRGNFDIYKSIYNWDNTRGNSQGIFEIICERESGIIRCKLKKDLKFSIVEEPKVEITATVCNTDKGDNVVLF